MIVQPLRVPSRIISFPNRGRVCQSRQQRHDPWPAYGNVARAKRIMDVCLTLVMLIPALPVILIAALFTKMTSRGPAIYAQTRVGFMGRPFTIYKIRSMVKDSEAQTGACWCASGDARVTRLGHFLRLSKIDELPQLWNILRGEMSLVGPRPERPELMTRLEQRHPLYRDRLMVLPGLSGLAQVQLPSDTNVANVGRKLQCDLYYVANASLGFDLRILVATLTYILHIPFSLTCLLLSLPRWQELADE